ncbi:MAG TPA: 30S ribosomal protein S16 [Longimicrobiaceae bacterium]|nr:30S ribosomal protein S16 [Longimicrobiaceae bacterium]
MALKIRLRRMGRKKAPHYRIVVAESSFPRDGRFVANVGHYNPTTNPATLVVNRDLALSWLGRGATPTDTVQSLFKKAGVYSDAPSVVETATEAVSGAADRAADAVKGAASAVAETAASAASAVVETVRDAAEAVAERVTGGDEEAAPAEAPAAPAEGEQPQG